MEKGQTIINRVFIVLLIACVIIVTVFGGRNIPTAYADSEDIQTRYEQTNVLNNLKGSTIGGNAFDLKDYPHNSNGKPQVISFVEFCYSYYAEKQSDYGLYIYVYNPTDAAIDTNTDRNKIQFTYGNKAGDDKYILKFLNYSKETGYEGRFYKFKIVLSDAQRNDILKTVNPDERIYKVTSVELSYKSKVTDYPCVQKYTYKGYALGYGSELAESDTLSCVVDGFDKYLSLDVRSTYWRPEGTHAGGSLTDLITRDTLHSVYFSVPNQIIDDYGEMTAVHATWLNAYTSPIFVTGNKTIYDAVMKMVGQTMDGGDLDNYKSNGLDYALLASKITNGSGIGDLKNNYYSLYYGYNVFEKQSKHKTDWGSTNVHDYDKLISKLCYAFYAENGNADTYLLPAEKLIGDDATDGWFKTYSDKHSSDEKVNNRYSKDLFEKVDVKFTDINIRSTDTYKLQDKVVSGDFWEILFGNWIKEDNEYEMQAIQKVTVADLNAESNKRAFCNKFYIAESDYDEFYDYVMESSARKETVYLFRYYQSEYVSAEVHEAKRYYHSKAVFASCMFHSDCPLGHGYYEAVDTNGYLAQMWVQLDFDIIDLTFTKDNVVTKIPVIMSPIDIAADADHPVYTTTDDKGLKWWQILLAIMLGILVIILLIKFAPGVIIVIGKVLLFVITLPFKLLGAIFKPIHNKAKAAREKRKLEREVKKERQRIEKARKAAEEKANKEEEKRAAAKRKQAEKERKRDERRTEKERKRSERRERRKTKKQSPPETTRKNKYSLEELDRMSDSQLAELYYEYYGFDDSDIPDELFD